VTTRYLLIKKF